MVKSWRVRRLLGKPVNLIGGEAFAVGQMTAASIAGMPAEIFYESHPRQPESDNSMTNSELLRKQPRARLAVDEGHP